MTEQDVAEWLVRTVRNRRGTFGNAGVTIVHDDKNNVTGLTLRKKTVVRSPAHSVHLRDTSVDRIQKATAMLIAIFKEISKHRGDADLSIEVQIQGGTVRNVSVMEARNLNGSALDMKLPEG